MPDNTVELRAGIDWSSAEATTSQFMANFEAKLAEIGGIASTGPEGSFLAGGLLKQLQDDVRVFAAEFNAVFDEATLRAATVLKPLKAQLENFSFKGPSSQKFGFVEGVADKEQLRAGFDAGPQLTPAQLQARSAQIIEAQAADAEYIAATVRLSTALLVKAATIDEQKLTDDAYLEATIRGLTARSLLAAAEAEAKAASDDYLAATILAATERNVLAAVEQELQAADNDYLESTLALAIGLNTRTAIENALKATDEDYLVSVELAAAGKNQEAAAVKEILAGSALYLESVARLAAANLALEAAERSVIPAVEQQAITARAAATGAVGGGTAAAGGAAAGGGLAGGLGTGLALIAGFTAYSQIRAAIKDAEELEKILAVTRVQMNNLGKGAEFDDFRKGIQSIAINTGSLNKDVAQTAQLLLEAFGGDTVRALNETNSAMQTVRVTGLSMSQVVNDFEALDKTFENSGITIDRLTSKALGLQERFGTLAKETIDFAAQLAPIGAEVGFTASDLEAIGASFEEFSGKPASAGAENLGRVFGGIQDKAVKLVEFLQVNAPNIAQSVATSIASGDVKSAFEELLANYDKLTQGQQQQLLVTIAGRRESSTLAAVFAGSSKLLDELNGKYDDAGKLQTTFVEVQKTFIQQLAELGAAFKKVGLDIYDAGLKDFLTGLGTELAVIIGAVDKLANAFDVVNSATHGFLVQLALVLVSLRAIAAIANSGLILKLLGGLGVSSLGGTAIGVEGGASVAEASGLAALLAKFNPLKGLGAGLGAAALPEGVVAGSIGTAETIGVGASAGITASLTSGLSAGFAAAGPGLILLGALAADKILGSLTEGVQGAIDRRIQTSLGGKTTVETETDINNILRGQGLGGDKTTLNSAQDLARFLQIGSGVSKPTTSLNEGVYDKASGWQQFLDNPASLVGDTTLGPTRSSDIDEKRDRLKKAENAIGANVKANLGALQNNAELLTQFLKDLQASGNTGVFGDNASPDSARSQIQFLISVLDKAGGDVSKLSTDEQRQIGALFELNPRLRQSNTTVEQNLKKLADTASKQEIDIQDAATAKQDFDAGIIGLAEYLSRLAAAQSALDALAEGGEPAAVKAAAKNRADTSKATSDALRRQVDFLKEARDIGGTDTPKSDVEALTQLLNDPKFTDEGDRLKATKDLVAAIKAEKVYEASLVRGAAEKAAILGTNVPLDEAPQQALYNEFLKSDVAFQEYLNRTLNGRQDVQKEITTIVATELANGERDIHQAIINGYRLQLVVLQAERNSLDELQSNKALIEKVRQKMREINDLLNQAINEAGPDTTVPDLSTIGGDSGATGPDPNVEAKAAANARLDILAAQANGDAVKLAEIAQERAALDARFATTDSERLAAQASMINADHELDKAHLAYADALRKVENALHGNDPLVVANNALGSATAALALTTVGTGPYLDALAAYDDAQHAYAKALEDSVDAQLNLQIAKLSASGNDVGAAKKKLEELLRRLADAPNEGITGDALLNLQAQIVAASANVAQTQISQGEQQIQTALSLGRISKGQAIAQLEALKVFAGNQKEIDQIDIEIKNLRGQLGQDFKFNLPSVLGLPTLYEARRLSQTVGATTTAGYNDNRTININLVAQTNATPQAIADAVASAVGGSNVNGTYPTRY